MLALSGGLSTAADAGIVITLTDNGDNTIASTMSGDFTFYAFGSSNGFGSFGSYLGANNGTISNASTSDAMTQFDFNYVDADGDASGAIAAAFGSGGYALRSYTGTGHLFQNFTSPNFKIDTSLAETLGIGVIGGPVTGRSFAGISASGTYVGSFASTGITAGTVVTRYGADSSNYDTLTIITTSAVPEPGTFGLSLLALGAIGLRRRRATQPSPRAATAAEKQIPIS